MREVTQERLAAYTTLRLGGPAGRFVVATTEEEAVAALREATRAGGPVLVLAGGSNLVVSDDGFPGTVVALRNRGLSTQDGGDGAVTVAAGHGWDDFVAETVERGLAGVECLSGIPGSAGATPIQNVGAYGQEVAETIVRVRAYDRVQDEIVSFSPAECGFAYRTSRFKHQDRLVVLSVGFALTASPLSTPIRYAELARTLGVTVGERAALAQVREAVLKLRAGKGMVLDPEDPDTYSVGSFFTNPVLPQAEFEALRAASGVEPPAWPAADGTVKVSAAWLIERAGFHKGYGSGQVSLSTKHTLALTNRGAGTTAQLLDLAREIRDGVLARFGVELHPEPVLVGCAL